MPSLHTLTRLDKDKDTHDSIHDRKESATESPPTMFRVSLADRDPILPERFRHPTPVDRFHSPHQCFTCCTSQIVLWTSLTSVLTAPIFGRSTTVEVKKNVVACTYRFLLRSIGTCS